jgi:hypothetical protein
VWKAPFAQNSTHVPGVPDTSKQGLRLQSFDRVKESEQALIPTSIGQNVELQTRKRICSELPARKENLTMQKGNIASMFKNPSF